MLATNKAASEGAAIETHQVRRDRFKEDHHRMSASRAIETHQVQRDRLEEDRLRMSASRDIETHQVRRDRLEEDRHRRPASRANQTTEQREARVEENRVRIVQTRELLRQSNLKLEAFNYGPQNAYQVHPNAYIGKMDMSVCTVAQKSSTASLQGCVAQTGKSN
ncbi:hypothetical protein AVEN_220363-1 [Araneus ventricosus]|uniref:Uncharacterized protein n=1 Tax=Araneus ventricosus TaxID=182803 RepID=A0A4Y2JKT3_ARAVE|nr:hypothetical protein AVEN_220363-1 [Araneus ventricosus]